MNNYLRVVSFCIISLASLQSHAQYQSIFGDSLTSWKSVTRQLFGTSIDSFYDTSRDTLLNSQKFRIIEGQSFLVNTRFFLSEDSTSGIVYYRSNTNDTNKYKIMDMSLTKGDTMFFEPNSSFKVDTTFIVDGRKHIVLDTTVIDFKMIEGAGTTDGIDYTWFNGARDFICVKKNDTIYYEDTSLTNYDCNSTVTGLNDEQGDDRGEVEIFQDVANQYISAKLSDQTRIQRIEIYSMTGQLQKRIKSNFHHIDISNLTSNVYLIKVYSDKTVTSKKILVSRP